MSRFPLLALSTLAAVLWGQGRPVTYDDTPQLPGQSYRVHGERPIPPVISPGSQASAPSDAIVLFDGTDLAQWRNGDQDASWKVVGDYMEVNGTGSIQTRREFGDVQLHLEFATPKTIQGKSQGRGNSGLFFFGRYEVQILDSYQNPSYPDGQCAAIYGQYPPRVNASRPPGEWQSYDVAFRAPRFGSDGSLKEAARVTVLHNGIFVHVDQELIGATAHRQVAQYSPHGPLGPIQLQDHGNPIRFRNIWLRALDQDER